VRTERWRLEGDPRALAARARALAPGAAEVAAPVAEIVADVAARGDAAVLAATRRFDTAGAEPGPLRAAPQEAAAALAGLGADVRAALELAIANVGAVARAGVGEDTEVLLPAGQRIVLREVPVRRAAIYVPGGQAPYPSTVVMGAVTARAAGVDEVAVCAPPGPGGEAHPAILAACALCGVDEIYRMGGAQAVAALALGTESVRAVDVVAGPGSLYVQEAKRQLSDRIGIDGFAGPSDLLVVLDAGAPPELVALDLLAQAEHGPATVVAAVSDAPAALDAVGDALGRLAPGRPSAAPAAAVLVQAPDLAAALAFAEAFAPEHLELVGPGPEALAPQVRSAGCLLVGAAAATAFSDYVAGSNHVLPTGGAARFSSGLSPRVFRRRMSEVRMDGAAAELAGPGAALARAEGFAVHAESMEARMRENDHP
jgi:histidinol dehydrogenase